jgi:ABC-type Na+ transport system ATPase subunit NatA
MKNHLEDVDYVPANANAAAAIKDISLKDRIKILERELKEEKEKDKGNKKKTKTSNAGRKKPNRLIADRPTSYNQQKDLTVRHTFEQFMARLMELNFGSTCKEQTPRTQNFGICMSVWMS